MPWLQLIIYCDDPQETNALSESLSELALAVTLRDAADQPIFEPPPGATPLWGNTIIIALFEEQSVLDNAIMQCQSQTTNQLRYKIEPLEDRDWLRECMIDFKPMQFGKRLWICPSWCEPVDPDAINILLDPGLAFGTGTHATTRLCLQWLDGIDCKNKTAIDYGCGSGILAIAALKLGAKSAWGVDIDPQALLATLDNAEKNKVDKTALQTVYPNQLPDMQCDILLANILAAPLLELAPTFAQLLKPNGKLFLSGILAEQSNDIVAKYETAFTIDTVQQDGDWVGISATAR